MTTSEPAEAGYSHAYRALQKRAANGENLTLAEIEKALASDPQTREALASLAVDLRAGIEISINAMAARVGVPVPFLIACAGALVTGLTVAATSETVH
jgi:hypothetical protein